MKVKKISKKFKEKKISPTNIIRNIVRKSEIDTRNE